MSSFTLLKVWTANTAYFDEEEMMFKLVKLGKKFELLLNI